MTIGSAIALGFVALVVVVFLVFMGYLVALPMIEKIRNPDGDR